MPDKGMKSDIWPCLKVNDQKPASLGPPRALARLWVEPKRRMKPDVPALEVVQTCLFSSLKAGPSHSEDGRPCLQVDTPHRILRNGSPSLCRDSPADLQIWMMVKY